MTIKLPLILLAASIATAELTTSFWMPSQRMVLGTDRIRWKASVVGAEGDRVTLAYTWDDDPDYDNLGFNINRNELQTVTFASTMWEYSMSAGALGESTITGDDQWVKCEKQSTGPVTCTQSLGSWYLNGACRPASQPLVLFTSLWTFSDPGTSGVETIVRSWGGYTRGVSEWCTKEGAETPGPIATFTQDPNEGYGLATYQFIITAGEEKLSATAGAGPTASDTKPTGTESGSGGAIGNGPAEPTGTGAAAPMKTMAPLMAGLGAAVAVFM